MSLTVQIIISCNLCKNAAVVVSDKLMRPGELLGYLQNKGWHGRVDGLTILAYCPNCGNIPNEVAKLKGIRTAHKNTQKEPKPVKKG